MVPIPVPRSSSVARAEPRSRMLRAWFVRRFPTHSCLSRTSILQDPLATLSHTHSHSHTQAHTGARGATRSHALSVSSPSLCCSPLPPNCHFFSLPVSLSRPLALRLLPFSPSFSPLSVTEGLSWPRITTGRCRHVLRQLVPPPPLMLQVVPIPKGGNRKQRENNPLTHTDDTVQLRCI